MADSEKHPLWPAFVRWSRYDKIRSQPPSYWAAFLAGADAKERQLAELKLQMEKVKEQRDTFDEAQKTLWGEV